MKPVPSEPWALQARIMSALIGDIADPKAKGFDRLDALRASKMAIKKEQGK